MSREPNKKFDVINEDDDDDDDDKDDDVDNSCQWLNDGAWERIDEWAADAGSNAGDCNVGSGVGNTGDGVGKVGAAGVAEQKLEIDFFFW